MNAQKSRKIIAACGMAVVVGIVVVTFALRTPPTVPVEPTALASAATPVTPETPVADPAVVAAPAAETAALPAAVPAAAALPQREPARLAAESAPPAAAPKARAPKAAVSPAPEDVVVAPTIARESPVADPVGDRADAPPPVAPQPASGDALSMTTDLAAPPSDVQITTDVKSALTADSASTASVIGVTTIDGVVVLTGRLPTQDAIDAAKGVAGKVKDVKSVDGTALVLASL